MSSTYITMGSNATIIAGYCADEGKVDVPAFRAFINEGERPPYQVEATWVLDDNTFGSIEVDNYGVARFTPTLLGVTRVTAAYRDLVNSFQIEVVPCFGIQTGKNQSTWLSGFDFETDKPVETLTNSDLYVSGSSLIAPYGAARIGLSSSDLQFMMRSTTSLPDLDQTLVHPSGAWAIRTRHGSVVLLGFKSWSSGVNGYKTWGWYRRLS